MLVRLVCDDFADIPTAVRLDLVDVSRIRLVAVLHIAAEPADDADMTIPLPPEADRTAARQALEVERAAVHSLVSTTLQRISHLGHRRTLAGIGLRLDRPDEVAVFLVGHLGEAAAGAWLLPLATRTADLVRGQFNATPVTTGVLLLPSMGLDAQAETMRARAALEELDAALRFPPSPLPAAFGGTLPLSQSLGEREGWLPPFNRGCYLLSPFNEEGLTLADEETLTEIIALGLYLHIFTPGRDALDWLPAPLDLDRRPTYASFGVAERYWPGDTAVRILACTWAADVLAEVLGETSPPRSRGCSDSLPTAGVSSTIIDLAPPRLIAEHLLPPDLMPALLVRPERFAAAPPWRLHTLRMEMDTAFAERAKRLKRAQARIERDAHALADETAHTLWQRLAATLDSDPVGGLAHAQRLADTLTHELHAYAEGLKTRLNEDREGLSEIQARVTAAAKALDDLVAPFPRWTLRELLPLLRRPAQVLRLALRYRRVQTAARRYRLLKESELETCLTIFLDEQAMRLYEKSLDIFREFIKSMEES